MAWTATDIPDLTGRVAVVTGANGGLGFETALALAGAGAQVVLAARDQGKAARAEEAIRERYPQARLELVALDLGSLASVRAAAEAIATRHHAIDILVNNAGIMAVPEGRTSDGFETQLGVNHLGHFAFTAGLLHALLRADAARVVTVTSTARHIGRPIDPADPHLTSGYSAWSAYGQAKLANHHFALGLQRRFADAGVAAQSLVAHPGLAGTGLQASTVLAGAGGPGAPLAHTLAMERGLTPEEGARPQLRAATDPGARGGQLYAPRWVNVGAAVRRPILNRIGLTRAIDTLWEVSERETGTRIDVASAAANLHNPVPGR